MMTERAALPEKGTEFPTEEKVILPFEHHQEYYVEHIEAIPQRPVYHFLKRCMDIVGSLCAIIVFFIPMIVIAIAIKLDSKGPVFYRQERLGLNGKPFEVIKFRSMRQDAEANGAQWSSGEKDPRITRVGHVLRKCRLDELPQFFQTLRGEMTLVGPRPERAVFYEEFEQYVHGFSERLKVKPGFTGLAQINGGYDLQPQEKVLYDLEYIKTQSLWLDIKILFKTVIVVFSHDGAK